MLAPGLPGRDPCDRRLLFGLWGLVGLCSTTGCSFLFVHGPPPDHERLPYFDCSSSNVLPVLDALYGGLAAAEAVAAGTGSPEFSRLLGEDGGLVAGRRGCDRRCFRGLRLQQDLRLPAGPGGDAQTGRDAPRGRTDVRTSACTDLCAAGRTCRRPLDGKASRHAPAAVRAPARPGSGASGPSRASPLTASGCRGALSRD